MPESLADGWWCTSCEFFEDLQPLDLSTSGCRACGCPEDEHTRASVVSSP